MFKSNPIFFKDLLISLNSKLGKNLIIAFSFIYFVAFLFILSNIKDSYDFTRLPRDGKEIFSIVGAFQIFALMVIGYIKGLQTISTEKANKTLDFIMISPISSFKFIIGKFLSSFLYVFLLFIISLPFLSIGLILGGVNIFDITTYILYSFSYISISILVGMVISSLSKNTMFSMIYGISFMPIFILTAVFFFGISPDSFNTIFHPNSENIAYSIFPIFIFDYISETNKYVDFYGLNIHYILYHIILFGVSALFLLSFLVKKYLKYGFKNIREYFTEQSCLFFILILLFTPMYENGFYLILFIFLWINTILYLFNSPNKISKKDFIFFASLFIISTILLLLHHGFVINTIILFILTFALLPKIYYIFILTFKKSSKGIINLYFFITIFLFFYVIPLISSNLLGVNYDNLNYLIKTSIYKDNIIKIDCSDKYYYKCENINIDGFYKYIIYYLVLNIILAGVIFKNRRKLIG